MQNIILGLIFSILWGSAATIGKLGFVSADIVVIFLWRFLIAGSIVVFYVHMVKREPLPKGFEWKQISVFAVLNTTLYLGLFAIALKNIAAGIATLSVALNPLLIAIFSGLYARKLVGWTKWVGIVVGILGVSIAVFPIMHTAHANVSGVVLLALSMVAYSLAAVYFSTRSWHMSTLASNGWQALIGGFFFIPFTMFFQTTETHFDLNFWGVLFWLVFPVSIVSIQIWLYLVRKDPVSASLWLFLCPIFGFALSWIMLGEPFTAWTAIGTVVVILALVIGRSKPSTDLGKH